jgi:ferredoxin
MSDILERTVGDLTIRLDRSGCQSYGHRIDEAPDAFALDADSLVDVKYPVRETREALLQACSVCPTEALSAFDADGNQLVP